MMLKHRYASLLLAVLAAAHFGCGSCGGDEEPQGVAPQITSDPVTTAVVGEDYRYHLTVTGTPEPTVTATGADGGELPGWLAFDAETLTLLGLAPESQIGVHQVVITAGNGEEPDAVQEFEITVSLGGVAPQIVSEPDTEAFTGAAYLYVLDATGSPEPTFQATNDSGGALAGWLSFDIESGTLSGTPVIADIGDHAVTITAGNGIDPTATQSFTINVSHSHEMPVITSTPVLEVVQGEEYSYEVVSTGYPLPVIAAAGAEGADLPEWLTMEDGLLSGTPGVDDVGEHDIVITATNVVGDDTQSFTITVARAPFAPTITSAPVLGAVVGDAYNYELTVIGHPEPVLAATTLPGWLSLDADTGIVSGTPAAGDVGDNHVVLTATNDEGLDTQSFTIAVTPAPFAPTITSEAVETAEAGVLYSYQVVATGYPVPTFAFTGADWLSIDENTGLLSGTPGFADVGDASIEVVASNSQGSATQNFVVTVTAVDTAPTFTSQPVDTAVAGVEYVYEIAATGYPLPTITVSGLPWWLSFDGVATISGTPDIFEVGETGQITVTATNAVEPDAQQMFTITVQPSPAIDVSAGPIFEGFGTELPQGWSAFGSWDFGEPTSGPNAAFEGDHVAATVLAGNYPNNDYSVLATPVLDLTNVVDAEVRFYQWYDIEPIYDGGRLVLSADGGLTWTPVLEDSIEPESSRYDWTISSGRWWSLRNQAEGWHQVIVDLDANLLDLARDQVVLAFEFFSDSWVDGAGWYVDDVQIGAAAELPGAPTITSTPVTAIGVGQTYSYMVEAEGVPAPTLSASGPEGGLLPAWLSFDPATGILSGAPAAGDVGNQEIEIVASNGIDPDAVQAFTITVLADPAVSPEITSVPGTTVVAGEEYLYQIEATGNPAPTFIVTGLPAWLSFDGVDTISGTPSLFDGGVTGDITIIADNGFDSDMEVFAITVEDADPIDLSVAPIIESFDAGVMPAGWFAFGDWEFGVPTSGPNAAYEGDHVAATVLAGSYSNSTISSMFTPALDLTNVVEPKLVFAHWYDIEGGVSTNWDGANIEISTDGGAEFTTLTPGSVTPAYTGSISTGAVYVGGKQGWSGTSGGWLTVEVDLEANLEGLPMGDVVLRFNLGTDSSGVRSGWYVDSIQIGAAADLPTAPTITSIPSSQIGVGQTYSYMVEAEGNPVPTFSASGGGGVDLPAWLAFDSLTGELLGEPLAADVGHHTIEIVASNGLSPDAVQTFTITVLLDPVSAPEITSTPAVTAEIDVLYQYEIIVTGAPDPVVGVTGLPSWMSMTVAENVTIHGTPGRLNVGTYEITVRAENGVQPDAEQVFTITVSAPQAIDVAAVPFSESFAAAELPQGWYSTSDWEIGAPLVGPATPFEGDNLAGTRLAANYNNSTFSSLLSPVLDLSGVDFPLLQFAHWYQTEGGGYDGGNVKISTDGGATFQALIPGSVVPAYTGTLRSSAMSGQPAWYGSNGGWELVQVDILANLGGATADQVVIRFDFASDGSGNGPGWYVDSINVDSAFEFLAIEELAGWDFDSAVVEDRPLAVVVAQDMSVGPMTHARGDTTYSGGNPSTGTAMSTTLWHQDDNYYEFVVTPDLDATVELFGFSFDANASNTGPKRWEVSFVDDQGEETTVGTGAAHTNWSGSPYLVTFGGAAGPHNEEFKIRIRGSGASGSGGTWRIDNVSLYGFVNVMQ